MVATSWSFADARQHFFIYTQRTDGTDLLRELQGSPIVAHADVNQLVSTLYENVRATALAASAPYYTAMLGTANGRTAAVQELIECARDNPDRQAFMSSIMSALTLLNDTGAFVGQSFEPLRQIYSNNLMLLDAFQALLRQATAMLWGAFEAYCYDLYRLLFTSKLALLRAVAAAYSPGSNGVSGTPWGSHPKKLADHIDAEALKVPPVAASDAFESYWSNTRLASMNLGAIRFFSGVLFASAPGIAAVNAGELTKLQARRHLLIHAAGVVDQSYVTNSGETLTIGTNLVVTPQELARDFRAVAAAAAALANAGSAAL